MDPATQHQENGNLAADVQPTDADLKFVAVNLGEETAADGIASYPIRRLRS